MRNYMSIKSSRINLQGEQYVLPRADEGKHDKGIEHHGIEEVQAKEQLSS
jgi:hypothetical protein